MIYLDNAASSPLLNEVISEMTTVMKTCYGNPSAIHKQGREARVLIEEARQTVARLVHASPSEIFFTSGGTEANNWAIKAAVETHSIKHIISAQTEHPAILKPVEYVSQMHHVKVSYLTPNALGQFSMEELERLLAGNEKTMVCLLHANNETGALLPLKDVSELCIKYNALFLCDMVQTIGKFAIDFQAIKIGFAAASAHKFHGPKGIGFLYLNNENLINAHILGGGQERNRRAGTECVYAIAGLAKALQIAYEHLHDNITHISELKNYLANKLREFDGVNFNADSDKHGLYSILNVAFPNIPASEMLVQKLDIAGIAVSGGSACASGSVKASKVLTAIKADTSKPAIRFSFSKFNTKSDIDYLIETLTEIYKQ
ncbi:MAG: cysteine desulfurase family protein [Bacteroidales bacterium]|nr:cysteine desulfurase family protein [Bacteroidales bacterium]